MLISFPQYHSQIFFKNNFKYCDLLIMDFMFWQTSYSVKILKAFILLSFSLYFRNTKTYFSHNILYIPVLVLYVWCCNHDKHHTKNFLDATDLKCVPFSQTLFKKKKNIHKQWNGFYLFFLCVLVCGVALFWSNISGIFQRLFCL